jgi:predicted nuclease of restriction endonuclease-like (RecB) superfamily
MKELKLYSELLNDIKLRVRQGQLRVNLSANAEMLATYWDVGKMIHERQHIEGWGAGVIPKLANDLKNELSEVKGFSERNLNNMISFYQEYSSLSLIWQPSVAKLETSTESILQLPVAKLESGTKSITKPSVAQLENQSDFKQKLILSTKWANHIILIQKVKDLSTRYWYMQQCINNVWSRDTLSDMIKSKLHERQGKSATNFDLTLPPAESQLAKEMLKDPYIFDFATLTTEFTERELENELIKYIEKFLVELGAGFAFVGRQYKLTVSDKDFYIDLLFYHLKMRSFVVIELKRGDFIPEYAGKMNFYCSAVDDILRHKDDNPTIGLILCQGKDRLFAEYSLKDINKPIGISEYELTRILPDNLKSSLPSIEEIEYQIERKITMVREEMAKYGRD